MENNNLNMTRVPPTLIGGLVPYLLLEFYDFPYLTVDKSIDDSIYLNFYVSSKGNLFERALVKISRERLQLFLSGELKLNDCYEHPENDLVYIADFNKSGKPVELSLISASDYYAISAIPNDYELEVDVSFPNEEVDLKLKSEQIHKILIDINLKAPTLKNKLKYWSIKQFLVPYTDLIRSALIKISPNYTQQSLDKFIDIGYNRLCTGSLISTIELNYNSNLFNESTDYNRIFNLFSVLNAENEKDLFTSLDNFTDKKIILEYLKILKIIIKQDASLNSKLAAPNKSVFEIHLDKKKAQRIKKIIDEKLPEIEDIEDIQGILAELSYRNQKPTFSIIGTIEDIKYVGKIDDEFAKTLTENQYQFMSKEYIFTVKTLYRPSTSTLPESIERTLLNIQELDEVEKAL